MKKLIALALAAVVAACSPQTPAEDHTGGVPVRFATDWRAQAEHGGFYQALATGEYAKRGLDVTIVQGGPGVNVPQLLASGAVELGMGSNSFIVLNLAQEQVPVKAVAAFFQKDPQVLIAHPDTGVNSIADMKGRPILLADASITAFWVWLKAKYGFTDDQVRKYSFNNGPFLADKRAIQQGYLSSEPWTIEQQAGFKPAVFLLADEGYPGYAAMVLAADATITNDPPLVAAFVEASAAGWQSYLTGDPAPGDALILKDNPEMTPDILAQARDKLRAYDITGDGSGVMTHERWETFFDMATEQGVYPDTVRLRDAYTVRFVSKPAG